jgi:hypothetical protein
MSGKRRLSEAQSVLDGLCTAATNYDCQSDRRLKPALQLAREESGCFEPYTPTPPSRVILAGRELDEATLVPGLSLNRQQTRPGSRTIVPSYTDKHGPSEDAGAWQH